MDCCPPAHCSPWDFPGKNTGVSCCFLLHGICLTQGGTRISCTSRQILYHWATLFPFIKVISGSNNILYRILIFHIKVTITKWTIPIRTCFKGTKVSKDLYFEHRDIPILTFYFILFLPGCVPYLRQIPGFVFFLFFFFLSEKVAVGHYQVISSH